MKIITEESGKVEYGGKTYKINQVIGDKTNKGLFDIKEIQRVFITEEDKSEIFEGYTIGQELAPRFITLKTHNGTTFEKFKKPKVTIVFADNAITALGVLERKKEGVVEILNNIEELLEIV